MLNTSTAVFGKKRRLSSSQDMNVCSLCDKPVAVSVEMSSSKRQQAKSFCLLHYYTTCAIRQDRVTILDQDVVDQELQDGVQQLFAEAFLEIQQELAHESAVAFQKDADPLAILHELHGRTLKAKRPRTKTTPTKTATTSVEGGFMRQIPLPERLLKTQQEQARLQREQVARMTESASNDVNPYERRKPSRQSIWHLAMKEPTKDEAKQLAAHRHVDENVAAGVICSCGSTNVSMSGNVTSRGGDMTKGETWGSKDRGDSLVTRYQCEACGRMWTEED